MASTVLLPQAVHMMQPRNPAQSSSSSRKLGFSSFVVSRQNYPSISLVSQNWFSCSRRLSNSSFIVRADENSESVAVETVEEVEPEIEKPLRKPIVKLGDIMGILNRQAVQARDDKRPIPDLRVGDIVEIKKEVPNKRRRFTIYKGIVMSKQNAGIHTTVRIRRIIAGIGVEIVFPIYSPMIMEIKVVKHRKVRRARLYYLRDKLPRFSTFK